MAVQIIPTDFAALRTSLNNSKLQTSNPPLWVMLDGMIKKLGEMQDNMQKQITDINNRITGVS